MFFYNNIYIVFYILYVFRMVLDYNNIFKDIKNLLIYTGVKDELLFKEEFKKREIYAGESISQWPGNINFNYLFVRGKNLRGTVRLMVEQTNKGSINRISESLETILNFGDLNELSRISIPKLNIAFSKDNARLEIDYRVNGRTNSLYLSAL